MPPLSAIHSLGGNYFSYSARIFLWILNRGCAKIIFCFYLSLKKDPCTLTEITNPPQKINRWPRWHIRDNGLIYVINKEVLHYNSLSLKGY